MNGTPRTMENVKCGPLATRFPLIHGENVEGAGALA
jgi:hypothetical protein